MELARFFGFLHPAFVHFPLVLLLISVGLDALGFFRRDSRLTWAAQILLLLGTCATLFAFVAGNFAEIWAARDGVPQGPMENHELLATITSWSFVFLTASRFLIGNYAKRPKMAAYLVLATCACVLLGFTGHRGAMLVYEHHAGVRSGTVLTAPTHEDLAVLNQKQDQEGLFYSNKMHHIFGVMVMLLSLLLLTDTLSPNLGERLRKIGPILLLIGGAYLMIYSDTDSWPLSSQRPITDKEVLMHKTYAFLMLAFGARGLWRKKGSKPVSPQMQARAMAIFALVGGALLFTHVHSNAPYANVAAGVYVHHTVMGFIALCIGAIKLIEDALLQRKREQETEEGEKGKGKSGGAARMGKGLRIAYPCLMFIESIFLLNYNEGLPWFLGYGGLTETAPHKGLVAPWGKARAEMTFNPNTNRLDVWLMNQGDNRPRPIAAKQIEAVVKVGTEATTVPLIAATDETANGKASHFMGTASFLHNAALFQTQALIPQDSKTGAASPLVADFEPWTNTLAAKGTRSTAAYICPMHSYLGSGSPGHCDVCGMALVANKPARPANKLHDDTFGMDLQLATLDAAPLAHPVQVASSRPIHIAQATRPVFITHPAPGQRVRLVLTPRTTRDGKPVTSLETVHTKKLHLIIASRDLTFFDHVHPHPQSDGSLILDYVFPAPGEYLLYADLTPTGDRNQVFRLPVTVSGTPATPQPLVPTPAPAKVFGDYRVAIAVSPDPPQSNDEAQVTFTVSENGVPVTDLEPFLGAGGHCVVLSEDSQSYLHSHPLEMNGPRYGPSVTFHTQFPHPGLYKIWGQFLHKGKPLTADFVIRVP